MNLTLAKISTSLGLNDSHAKKGTRIFLFSTYERLRYFIGAVSEKLISAGIPYTLYGNACFEFEDGNRMIFIVRHSSAWKHYAIGHTLVDWASDEELPERDQEFMNSMIRG